MIHEIIPIQEKGSEKYARMCTYFWEYSEDIPIGDRPVVLICPGGAYYATSDREAEAIALKIMDMGFHAAVLRYSVAPAKYPTALTEVARAVSLLREHAKEWHIDKEKIAVMGFSAGGHLAAGFGVFWNEPFLADAIGCETEKLRPNALLLCYPVITSDPKYWHEGSFRNLLGEEPDGDMLGRMSLEKQVGEQVPKTFIWHTFEDESVPAENSLLWVQALMRHKIPVEFHLYEKGIHGLSLATELTDNQRRETVCPESQSWITLAQTWLKSI